MATRKKVNELLTYAFLDSFKFACILFVIMLTELQKILHQELKCLCGKTAAVRSE